MPGKINLFTFFGLIASGKSHLAEAWAARSGAAYFNSDRIRKELAGIMSQSGRQAGFNQGIYTPEFSRKTYDALLTRAEEQLAAGRQAILDASYHDAAERARVKQLADKYDCRVIFILCTCPEEIMKERMALRARDPNAVSDGRWEVYLRQKKKFTPPDELGPDELITINTDSPVNLLVKQLESMLQSGEY